MELTFAQTSSDARSFVTRQVAGETLIVPVTGRMADLESIFVLNPVAARIWQLLQSPITVAAIAGALAHEFDVTVETARADADAFVAQLSERGLVQPVRPEATA